MPQGDRTGPNGLGPRTGRAAGFCSGYAVPGYMNPGFGAGFGGRGRGGGGRGWRHCYYATGLTAWQRAPGIPYGVPTQPQTGFPQPENKQQELDALRGQADYLEDALEGIQQRIAALEKEMHPEEK